jgi:hypothetical protein
MEEEKSTLFSDQELWLTCKIDQIASPVRQSARAKRRRSPKPVRLLAAIFY